MSKRYLRKRAVAERYDCHERTVDRMADEGRIPAPHYHGSRVPRWDEAELDAADRAATREAPLTTPNKSELEANRPVRVRRAAEV